MLQFADSRTAYDDLSEDMKKKLDGLVANHSLFHSRKTAMPEYFQDTDPMKLPLSKHKIIQKHEWSGRTVSTGREPRVEAWLSRALQNLYIASYVHHIEDMPMGESRALIEGLMAHVSQPKYRVTIPWESEKDMIIWYGNPAQTLEFLTDSRQGQHIGNASRHWRHLRR